MRQRQRPLEAPGHPIEAPEEVSARFAWWAAFFGTLVVVAVLGLVSSAGAAVPAPGPGLAPLEGPSGFFFEPEAEEEEEPCEWEEDDAAWEECIEAEEAAAEAMECVLSSASATLAASAPRRTALLTVRYSAWFAAPVSVRAKARGVPIATERRHFGRSGTYRRRARLGRGQVARLLGAREVVVELHASGAPRHCRDRFRLHLEPRRHSARGGVWAGEAAW